MPRQNARRSSPSASSSNTNRSPRTPPNARITPSTQPPPVRSTSRVRRRSNAPSTWNNNTRNRIVRHLFQTNEVLEPSNTGRPRKRTRPNTGWRKRVPTQKIPANVPESNRMGLFTTAPVTRGIPCVQCKKYLAKSNFRGLTRLGHPCPYCRHPIRKSNYNRNKPNSKPKRKG